MTTSIAIDDAIELDDETLAALPLPKNANALAVRDSKLGALFGRMSDMEAATDQILASLPTLADDQLSLLVMQARGVEGACCRIRGAALTEILARIARRQTGGRSRGDINSEGVMAQAAKLASDLHMGISTLVQDAKVYQTLSAAYPDAPQTVVDVYNTLSRDHLVAAMSAPEPKAAIEMAVEKVTAGESYSADRFRKDIKEIRTASPEKRGQAQQSVADSTWYNARITPAQRQQIHALQTRFRCTHEQVLGHLLEEYGASSAPPLAIDTRFEPEEGAQTAGAAAQATVSVALLSPQQFQQDLIEAMRQHGPVSTSINKQVVVNRSTLDALDSVTEFLNRQKNGGRPFAIGQLIGGLLNLLAPLVGLVHTEEADD